MICFFSSRRRHTRFDCDWSSDVCSSDLYEDRIVSPVRTFYKSQRSIVTRALEVVRVTKLVHITERLRFPERISRIPFWGRLLSYAIFLELVAIGLEILIAPRSESILNALSVLAANVTPF